MISQGKNKTMHIYRKTGVSSTTEAGVEGLTLAHKCDVRSQTFPKQRELKIHAARWCDAALTPRLSFDYLGGGGRMQCDEADVRHRIAIAQTTYGSLQHMDRPPVVAFVKAEDVPACCVFDADTRI